MSLASEVFSMLGTNYAYILPALISTTFIVTAYFVKQGIDLGAFAYTTTRVRAMSGRMLKQNKLKELADSYSASDIIAAFEGSAYEHYVAGKSDLKSIEQGLALSLAEDYHKIRRISPKKAKPLFDFLSARYDLENIRNIVASKISGEPIKMLMPSTISEALLQKLIEAETIEEMFELLKETRYKELIGWLSESKDIKSFERSVERYVREELYRKNDIKNIAKKCGIMNDASNLREIFGIQNDILNIKIALRFIREGFADTNLQKFFVKGNFYLSSENLAALSEAKDIQSAISALQGTPYHQIMNDAHRVYLQEKSLYVFECALDSFYAKVVRSISFRQPFGLTPIVCYLLQKEQEVKTISMIMNCIEAGLPKEKIMNMFIGA